MSRWRLELLKSPGGDTQDIFEFDLSSVQIPETGIVFVPFLCTNESFTGECTWSVSSQNGVSNIDMYIIRQFAVPSKYTERLQLLYEYQYTGLVAKTKLVCGAEGSWSCSNRSLFDGLPAINLDRPTRLTNIDSDYVKVSHGDASDNTGYERRLADVLNDQ